MWECEQLLIKIKIGKVIPEKKIFHVNQLINVTDLLVSERLVLRLTIVKFNPLCKVIVLFFKFLVQLKNVYTIFQPTRRKLFTNEFQMCVYACLCICVCVRGGGVKKSHYRITLLTSTMASIISGDEVPSAMRVKLATVSIHTLGFITITSPFSPFTLIVRSCSYEKKTIIVNILFIHRYYKCNAAGG